MHMSLPMIVNYYCQLKSPHLASSLLSHQRDPLLRRIAMHLLPADVLPTLLFAD